MLSDCRAVQEGQTVRSHGAGFGNKVATLTRSSPSAMTRLYSGLLELSSVRNFKVGSRFKFGILLSSILKVVHEKLVYAPDMKVE